MLCLPIATGHDVMTANFGESFTSMAYGNFNFVFVKVSDLKFHVSTSKFDLLCFTAVSDLPESETFLRNQLRLIHELLQFIFGPKNLHTRNRINWNRHQKLLQKLIDTMCWMTDRCQNYLVEVMVTKNHFLIALNSL